MRGFGFLLVIAGAMSLGAVTTPMAQSARRIPGSFDVTPASGMIVAQDAAPDAVDAPADAAAPVAKKKKPKRKPKKPKMAGAPGKGQVLVVNNRGAALRELTLTSKTAPDKSGVVAKNLAPGAKAIGKVPAKAGCEFSVAGEFDDGTSLALDSVEVCTDRTLNLTE